jgi:Family of unknown function (DUF5647)
MIDPATFAQRQMELSAEFAKYIIDHPDIDESLPDDSYIYFQIDGEPEFNEYSQHLAERREREEGAIAICVQSKGLAPPQGSRLIDPQIVASPNLT